MYVQCTVLDKSAQPMNTYTDALFTADAIAKYVNGNRKRVISKLKLAARAHDPAVIVARTANIFDDPSSSTAAAQLPQQEGFLFTDTTAEV
jgi:hypothetical protein